MRLGRIWFSTRKALIKTSQCSKHLQSFYSKTRVKIIILRGAVVPRAASLRPLLEMFAKKHGNSDCYIQSVYKQERSRLINNPHVAKSPPHRHLVGILSIFYRYFQGHYFQEIMDVIPAPLRRVRTTRNSTHSHPFHTSLPTPRTLSHISSFAPRTCSLWNVLSSSCFPEYYNLPSSESKINKLDLISLSPLNRPLLSSFVGALYRPKAIMAFR